MLVRRRIVGLFGVLVAVGASSWSIAACSGVDCTAAGTCGAPADGGGDGTTADSGIVDGAGDGDVITPPGCDFSVDPIEAACVVESAGIFVSSSGSDSGAGTKSSPVKTIAEALGLVTAAKAHVFVCAGTYAENVSLTSTSAASIYGGFDCSAWTYAASNEVKVTPASGVGLSIDSVTSALSLSDMEYDGPAGTSSSANSIAGFVNASPSVTLRRLKLVAASGGTPSDAQMPATNHPNGQTAATSGAGGGAGGSVVCADGKNSTGGNGGKPATAAMAGKPTLTGGGPGLDGTAGSNAALCGTAGGPGAGDNAAMPAVDGVATHAGALSSNGWSPSSGTKGTNGAPGQGGGGGGDGAADTGTGGGGSAGGCGGAGGVSGTGGGASIALVTVGSPVALVSCTLVSGAAGNGAKGSDGEAAQAADLNDVSGAAGGCGGGQGGAGAGGNGGGGGAGGVSFGLLFSGAIPTLDGSAASTSSSHAGITVGTKGSAGSGGVAGPFAAGASGNGHAGNDGAPGPDGVAGAVQQYELLP